MLYFYFLLLDFLSNFLFIVKTVFMFFLGLKVFISYMGRKAMSLYQQFQVGWHVILQSSDVAHQKLMCILRIHKNHPHFCVFSHMTLPRDLPDKLSKNQLGIYLLILFHSLSFCLFVFKNTSNKNILVINIKEHGSIQNKKGQPSSTAPAPSTLKLALSKGGHRQVGGISPHHLLSCSFHTV